MGSNTRLTLKPTKGAEPAFGHQLPPAGATGSVNDKASPGVGSKPSQAESRRDRVAINVFQALITRFATADTTRAPVLAQQAFDYADAFLAERAKRGGAHE